MRRLAPGGNSLANPRSKAHENETRDFRQRPLLPEGCKATCCRCVETCRLHRSRGAPWSFRCFPAARAVLPTRCHHVISVKGRKSAPLRRACVASAYRSGAAPGPRRPGRLPGPSPVAGRHRAAGEDPTEGLRAFLLGPKKAEAKEPVWFYRLGQGRYGEERPNAELRVLLLAGLGSGGSIFGADVRAYGGPGRQPATIKAWRCRVPRKRR